MELKIDLKKLQAALKVCIEFVPTRAVLIGWTRNFIFRDGFIYATDNTLGIYYRMPEYNFGNGFMVRAEDFFAYIQKVEGEEIILKIGDGELEVIAGRKRATFVMDTGVDKVAYVPGMSIDCQKLENDFRGNLLEVKLSMHDSLTSMDGIFLHDGYAYATNSKSCTRCACKSWPAGDVFLPRSLIKRVEEFKDVTPLGLAVIENFIFLKYDGFVVFHRRVDESSVVPVQQLAGFFSPHEEGDKSVSFDGSEAIKSLARVSVFAEREDRRISLKLTPLLLIISAQGKWGRSEEDVTVRGSHLTGEEVKSFEVDSHYFDRLLEVGGGSFFIRDSMFGSRGKMVEYIFMGFTPQS